MFFRIFLMGAFAEGWGPRHLIHVGFPKAASTSLQAWFTAHPDLIFHQHGLAGYHGARELARDVARDRSAAWYVTSCEDLVIPKLPGHTFDVGPRPTAESRRQACELLHSLFTNAMILIVTRSHSTVLKSGYSEYLRHGGHLSMTRLEGYDFSQAQVEEDWDYDATLTLYESVFGPENVIVLPYELLVDDAAQFTRILEDRLGIAHAEIEMPRLNTSLTSAELRWYPRFASVAAYARARLGAPGRRLAAAYYARIGHPRLRRAVSLLAKVIPEPHVDVEVPPGLLASYRRHAVALARRAEYEAYRTTYLGTDAATAV